MTDSAPPTDSCSTVSDEELAARCAEGIDSAERELINRYMQVIYWLPRRAFGAPEDRLADFLIYAIEKLRARDVFGKYDAARGAKFRTWFGVVTRNLYLDYLRTQKDAAPREVSLHESMPEPTPTEKKADHLLEKMQTRCRTLFKLLLCNTFFLDNNDLRWIAETSGRSLLEVTRSLADLEEQLRNDEARINERYDKVVTVSWHLRQHAQQLAKLESKRENATPEERQLLKETAEKLARRRDEHARLLNELAGSAGIATAPYRDLAALLNLKEGTLASQISRCRVAAAEALAAATNENNEGGQE